MLIVTPDRNTHDNDFGGAFDPEAMTFMVLLKPGNHQRIKIDVSKSYAQRNAQLLKVFDAPECLADGIVFFCHGWASGIQGGLRNPDIAQFAKLLGQAQASHSNFYPITLYCCTTGDSPVGGDGSFADRLRDALCQNGLTYCQIYAHTNVGHTTENPYARMFRGEGSTVGSADAQWVVRPPSKGVVSPLWKPWVKALNRTLWAPGATLDNAAFSGTTADDKFSSVKYAKMFRFYAPYLPTESLHMLLDPQNVAV